MSDLLNSASLVMIPSGYKEDVVYSQIPTDGSGDLSFTRASNGTRVNSAGLVEVCPWNVATYSEDFTNSAYSKTLSTITSNATTAPNGTTTADKLVEDTSNGLHRVGQDFISVESGQVYTFSFYAKASERTSIELQRINTSATVFNSISSTTANLTSGTLSIGSNVTASNIENVGNGWYRISISLTAIATGTGGLNIGLIKNGDVSYLGDGTSGVFVWGYQANIGSTAKPYFPTTDRLNVPRLTYQNGGGGCPSLLLEKQSTNVETWSEDFSNASWTKTNCSITANTTTSPDGTQNADKIIENSVNGVHFTFNVGATLSVAQTLSVYAKADTRTQLALQLGASSVIYNLSNGTIVSGSGGAIVNAGNGWYRCSITTTPANTNALIFTANGGTNSYQGDGTSGLFIWGAQLEASSYPTSYIPTTSSSATRVADACFKTGISSLIGQTEGVIFWEGKISDVTGGELCDLNANGDKFIQIYNTLVGSTPTIGLYIQNVSVLLNNSNIATIAYNSNFKFALAYKNNDYVAYLNGVQVYVNTTIGVPATSNFSIGAYNQGDVTANKNTNQVALFKTRLTNAELASLTTI